MLYSRSLPVLLLLFLSGDVLLVGCGGPSPAPPTSGTGPAATSGKTSASIALPRPVDPNAVNLSALPQIEGAKFAIRTGNRLEGVANGKVSTIFEHYSAALEKLGWKLSGSLTKVQVTDDSASALMTKRDNSIFLSVFSLDVPGRKDQAGEKHFSVGNLGTCDSGKLPRLPGAELGYARTVSTLYYTDMKVAATAASVRNLLQTDGWQEFSKPYAGKPTASDFFHGEYRKQDHSLQVVIRPAPADDKKSPETARSSVQYVIGAVGHQLPAPPDATEVEFDDAQYVLRCEIPRELPAVAKYYRDAMAALGYEPPPQLPGSDSSSAVIVFTGKGDDSITIDLVYTGLSTRAELRGPRAKDGKTPEKVGK